MLDCETRDLLGVAPRDDLSVWVVRRDHVERARGRRDGRGEERARVRRFVFVERGRERHLDDVRASLRDDPVRERPIRRRDDDLVAGLEHDARSARERVRRAHADEHVGLGRTLVRAPAQPHVGRERLTELGHACRRAICVERLGGRAFDRALDAREVRRRAVGVADVERDEIAPRGAPRGDRDL